MLAASSKNVTELILVGPHTRLEGDENTAVSEDGANTTAGGVVIGDITKGGSLG